MESDDKAIRGKKIDPSHYLRLLKESGIRYVISPENRSAETAKAQSREEELLTDNSLQSVEIKQIDSKHATAQFTDTSSVTSSLFSAADDTGDYESLDQLKAEVGRCTRCDISAARTNVVFGEGNPNAEIIFIGEAPGFHEDIQGRPFVGRAGNLLTKMIEAMGYNRKDVYIANIIKCRPPENRNPNPDEAANCIPYLHAQIGFIQPKVIVALGSIALNHLLNRNIGISKIRGIFQDYKGIPLMPTFHPAYLLRNPAKKKEAWEDLKQVMASLGKPVE
jgi:DNA polymerase